ncbi:hypothetical protein TWF569_001939 [Orbilia oligospora]|uniref:Thioredoxin-like fold domain-containing protein n=1 Tax=Orbilia oligospora TaxID=2813651 RepID=A0A7C8P7N8_ORBOL|nr:hypothetical protein TWF706_006340 [Orbilia oligospora]KAF3104937.1 hypothetical protein TWF102_002700 [Orbilia oligospora]KAF3116143.1 hypothetical protein TWF103_009371 [Orbilia oligospora]KAF3137854.1 hypothetical protein TWF703_004824 [Orbilia oligospora]KAF3146247.1 hypothetical protein TWF594_003566 [Orbilia oligospora]
MSSVKPADNKTGEVVLFAFEKRPGNPTASGFCQKVECYLRFAGVKYTQEDTLPFKAPKKKLPYVNIDGAIIPDSQFIVRYIKEKGLADLDKSAGLTQLQIVEGVAYRGYWEEAIYPAIVRSRWFDKENEAVIAREVFGDLPFFLRIPLHWWFRRSLTHSLVAQGVGRHSDSETEVILREALESLEIRLTPSGTTTEWFHRTATPADIDAVISAMLINLCGTNSNPFCKKIILGSKVLCGYMKRAVEGFFPEFEILLKEVEEAEGRDGPVLEVI